MALSVPNSHCFYSFCVLMNSFFELRMIRVDKGVAAVAAMEKTVEESDAKVTLCSEEASTRETSDW